MSGLGRSAVIVAVAAAILACASCDRVSELPARHLVLVTLDTTRRDRLGCYGRAGAGTPWLDALASRGTVFDRAYSAVPLTLPSHVTILSGLYPTHTAIHANGETRLAPGVRLLAERLAAAGFFTAAAVGGYPVTGRFPVRRGFEAFDDRLDDPNNASALERDGGEVVRAALRATAARRGRRLFLWVHLYDPHDPYAPPSPFRERYASDPYQGEIARVDAALSELAAGLATALGGEPALVCVVGDHGEALGDHGEPTHGFFLYEPTVRVPLILSGPRVPKGVRRADPVSTADLVPTLLTLLDLPAAGPFDGIAIDLGGAHPSPARRLYLETELPQRNYGWAPLRAAIAGSDKLIAAPRRELYDVVRDPGETANLQADRATRADALEAWVRDATRDEAAPGDGDGSRDSRLRSLGYVGAGAPAGGSSAADPKDRVSTYVRFTEASRDLERGDAAAALPVLNGLLAEADTPGTRFERAEALRMAGRFPEASADLDRVASADPRYPGIHLERMQIAAATQDWARVLAEGDLALAEDPEACEALLFRGAAREMRGDVAAAEADYRKALEINPAFGRASLRLAALLVRTGRIEEARAALQAHLKRHPGDPLAQGLLDSI